MIIIDCTINYEQFTMHDLKMDNAQSHMIYDREMLVSVKLREGFLSRILLTRGMLHRKMDLIQISL